ncbi:MAG: sensor histidine kinase [Parvibaculales bacterium]
MLTDSELQLLETLGSVSEDGLIVIDEAGVVAFANSKALSFFGARIKSRRLQNFVRHPDFLDVLQKVTQSGAEAELTHHLSGTIERTFSLNFRSICTTRHLALLVVRDLTSARMLERMRSDFVANVSHELRSPLTSLIGFIQTLNMSDTNAADLKKYLTIMNDEAMRMNRLINDLLSLSQQVADSHVLPSGVVDLNGLAEDAVSSLSQQAKERGIALKIHNEGSESADGTCAVNGSYEDLRAVLVNLLDNAIKYGDAEQDVRIVIEPARHQMIEVRVINVGEGIEAEHIPRLTERFYRADKARARQTGGAGLGLAIVKHIVQRHRGRLRISSEPQGETTFTVILPAAG